ncbi:MAG: hypothetical protein FWE37_08760 [Spirochaetaceae bacterium]|nr:hypothetical protein [Spirochaetaceae bacterium]
MAVFITTAILVIFLFLSLALQTEIVREWLDNFGEIERITSSIVVIGIIIGNIVLIDVLFTKKMHIVITGSSLNINNDQITIFYRDITKLELNPVYTYPKHGPRYLSGYRLRLNYNDDNKNKKLRMRVGGVDRDGVVNKNTQTLLDFYENLAKRLN